jgi:putative membrane-bound dehydrogenase-like protein
MGQVLAVRAVGAAGDAMPPMDSVRFAGLAPAEAARQITLPAGFQAHLFAGEPDVRQPIAFCIDDRGRVWVAEGHTYPRRAPEGEGRDRILILEDTDGDHRFDRRTVFMDGLNLVSGLEVGFGGVWVGAAPHLLFVPDQDGDDRPDAAPVVLLDGWDYKADTHETLNTFIWGPDGWLYGCHGVFCPSHVGKPGTAEDRRQRVDAAVWRYHPTRHEFEVFAEGTSNPWGIDFDEYGQCFIEACVIPHLFHMIQGGRYERQGGQHYQVGAEERNALLGLVPGAARHANPHIYEDIKTVADHVHYAGDRGPHAGNSRSDAAGGGHAHAGLMVYLGGGWPQEYRGRLFMNNIHGQRLNVDLPERRGSGYTARHGKDFALFNDAWSQVLNLLYDQDGSVCAIDWYDKNQCHHNDAAGHDRSNGRVFKIVFNAQRPTAVDLRRLSSDALVQLQLHTNDWYVRHARRLLQERGPEAAVHRELRRMVEGHSDVTRRLRALWSLQVTGGLDEPFALTLLQSPHEHVRAWVIQCQAEARAPSAAVLGAWERLAREDPSPVVRLYLAAALQRTPVAQRWNTLTGLVAHAEDAADQNLPLMYWYAAHLGVGQDAARGLALLRASRIPKLREFIARRLALATVSAAGAVAP